MRRVTASVTSASDYARASLHGDLSSCRCSSFPLHFSSRLSSFNFHEEAQVSTFEPFGRYFFPPVPCNDAELGSGDVEGCTKHFIGNGGPCDAKLKDQGLCGTSFPQQRGRSKFAERWKQQQTDSQTEKPTDRLTGQPRKTRNEKTFCIYKGQE